jgi:hypothetical protein
VLVGVEELIEFARNAAVLCEVEVRSLLGTVYAALATLLVKGRTQRTVHQTRVRLLGRVVVLHVVAETAHVDQPGVVGGSDEVMTDALLLLVVKHLVLGADYLFLLAHLEVWIDHLSRFADYLFHTGLKLLAEDLVIRAGNMHLLADMLLAVVPLIGFTV